MPSRLWKSIFEWIGWKTEITVDLPDKCVICVAPHTSNLDFIIGLIAYRSLGRKANFLMKKFWFFFPLKYLLSSLGGIPVVRKGKKDSLTKMLIDQFRQRAYLNLAVTPEGTRKAVDKWRTGFLYIARDAEVPVLLAVIDYKNKTVRITESLKPGENIEKDLSRIRKFYAPFKDSAKYPEKFKA